MAAVAPEVSVVASRRGWLDPVVAWTRRSTAAAIGVAVVAMVLTWIFRTGIVPTDPWHYVRSALYFPDATWVPLGYTRYGMILPLLPVVAVFGNAEISYYVWPLIGTGLLTASLYLIGLRFWGRGAGLLAVVFGLISPITAVNLSRGYPDVIGTGLFGMAMVLAFLARDRMTSARRSPEAWPSDRFDVAVPGPPSDSPGVGGRLVPVALLVAVGFFLGWGFEARETTILTWPAIAVILLGRRRVLPVLCWLAAGIGVWVIADLAIGQFGYRDLLIRVHAFTNQDLGTTTAGGDLAAQAALVGHDRLFYLTEVPRLLLATGATGAWTLTLGVVGLLGLIPRGATRFSSGLLVLAFVGFVGITGMFFPDHPSGRIDIQRYWISFLPWLGLAAAGTVRVLADLIVRSSGDRRANSLRLRRGAFVALAVLLGTGPAIATFDYLRSDLALVVNGNTPYAELGHYLATEHAPVTIYSDPYSLRILNVYQRSRFGGTELWQGDTISLDWPGAEPKPGDLVALNHLTAQACAYCNGQMKIWRATHRRVPPNWQEVWSSSYRNLVLYRVRSAG